MRISGYGSGSATGGGGGQRADIFRSRHHVGERLRGRILRHEPGGLTLVEVDGQELLARLEADAAPGTTLFFLVRALVPEIHLQALQGHAASSDAPSLLHLFRTTRELFEKTAVPIMASWPVSLPPTLAPPPSFLALLTADPELDKLWDQLQDLLVHINAAAQRVQRQALYAPWIFPGLCRQEILWKSVGRDGPESDLLEMGMSGMTARHGTVELRLLSRKPEHSLRLYVERQQYTQELVDLASEALGARTQDMSLGRLPSPFPGGLYGELLGDAPAVLSGSLNARI